MLVYVNYFQFLAFYNVLLLVVIDFVIAIKINDQLDLIFGDLGQ